MNKLTNETYEIEIGSPLLRPGIVLRTEVSGKYLVMQSMLNKVREINDAAQPQQIEASQSR